jgi:predicted small metal-binding protein
LYEFICDRIIPGCTYEERGEKEEEVLEQAMIHFKEHHAFHHHNDPIDDTLRKTGMVFIRPA